MVNSVMGGENGLDNSATYVAGGGGKKRFEKNVVSVGLDKPDRGGCNNLEFPCLKRRVGPGGLGDGVRWPDGTGRKGGYLTHQMDGSFSPKRVSWGHREILESLGPTLRRDGQQQ